MTSHKRAPWVGLALTLIYVFSVPGHWLVATRIVILSVTIAMIMGYMSESRSRPLTTALAIIIAGASMAMIMQAFTNFVVLSAAAEPWFVLLIFAYTALLVRSRGNVAKIFATPRPRSARQ